MKSTKGTIQNNQTPRSESDFAVSRRNIIVSSASAASMTSTTGTSNARTDDTLSESNEFCKLTITVIGLEIDGPINDAIVEIDGNKKVTDESGQVSFKIEKGVYEVEVETEEWTKKIKTIEVEGTNTHLRVPLCIKHYNDLTVLVRDASCGKHVNNVTISINGYGSRCTKDDGITTMLLECRLEPTEHTLIVTADGYHNEQRQIKVDDDKQFCIDLIPK